MKKFFGETLRQIRIQQGFSQKQLADMIHVDRSSVARWEKGRRLPDVYTITQLSDCLGLNVGELLDTYESDSLKPNIIMVDDERIILNGGIPVIKEVIPNASVTGFTKPSDALEFADENKVNLAFLDIEMRHMNGLDLCEKLLELDPRTNVIYLTAYQDYSFDAWKTGACGFMLKPLDEEKVQAGLKRLRYPLGGAE